MQWRQQDRAQRNVDNARVLWQQHVAINQADLVRKLLLAMHGQVVTFNSVLLLLELGVIKGSLPIGWVSCLQPYMAMGPKL